MHVTELAAALARGGHHIHVFTRRALGQPAHDVNDGVHYHRCNYPGQDDFVDDVNAMCRAFVDRVFEVEDLVGPFDIIHAHDWLAANAMIWIKQGRGHRTLLTIHATEYARAGNAFPKGQSERVRAQERAGTYWADHVIAVSQATKDEIRWMYEVPDWKASVVYNGVEPKRFDAWTEPGEEKRRHQIAPLDPTILFCGRLVWQKGPDLLLEAIPRILRAQPNSKFLFAGDGEMRPRLEARARQLGVWHAVRFLGHRRGDELVPLFRLADAVCVPSRNEPFGIVVLEAWSARKPVIVTQNGGPNEYVRHEVDGLKIHATPESVAWGVTTMFQDFDRARWMGENGRQAVEERFTWGLVADQTLGVYEQVCPEAFMQERAAREAPVAVSAHASFQENHCAVSRDEPAGNPMDDEERELAPVYMNTRLSFRESGLGSGEQDLFAVCQSALVCLGLEPLSGDRGAFAESDMETAMAALSRWRQHMILAGVWKQRGMVEAPRSERTPFLERVGLDSHIGYRCSAGLKPSHSRKRTPRFSSDIWITEYG